MKDKIISNVKNRKSAIKTVADIRKFNPANRYVDLLDNNVKEEDYSDKSSSHYNIRNRKDNSYKNVAKLKY